VICLQAPTPLVHAPYASSFCKVHMPNRPTQPPSISTSTTVPTGSARWDGLSRLGQQGGMDADDNKEYRRDMPCIPCQTRCCKGQQHAARTGCKNLLLICASTPQRLLSSGKQVCPHKGQGGLNVVHVCCTLPLPGEMLSHKTTHQSATINCWRISHPVLDPEGKPHPYECSIAKPITSHRPA
jgi:hypothetical protein